MNRKWTRAACVDALDIYIRTHNAAPKTKDILSEESLADPGTFRRYVGQSYNEYIIRSYPEMVTSHMRKSDKSATGKKSWAELDCIRAVQNFIRANSRIPTQYEMTALDDLPAPLEFKAGVGRTLNEYAKEIWPQFVSHAMPSEQWTEPVIKEAVGSFVQKNGRLPKIVDCNFKNGLPSRNTFMNVLGISLIEFLRSEYPDFDDGKTVRWTQESIKDAIGRFINQQGRYPSTADLTRLNNLPVTADIKKTTGMTPGQYRAVYFPELPKGKQKLWSEEKIREAVDAFIKANNRLPLIKEFNNDNGLPTYITFSRVMHSGAGSLCREWYPEVAGNKTNTPRAWTKEKLDAVIDGFVSEHGSLPTSRDYTSQNGMPSRAVFYKLTGITPSRYYTSRYPEMTTTRHSFTLWTKDAINEAIDNFVAEHGRLPRYHEVKKKNGFPSYCSFNRFINKGIIQYCRERHPEFDSPRTNRRRWNKENVAEAIDRFVGESGRAPRYDEMKKANGLPSYQVIKQVLLKSPVEYCRERYPEIYATAPFISRKEPKWSEERYAGIPATEPDEDLNEQEEYDVEIERGGLVFSM